jgi:hypothetical protein
MNGLPSTRTLVLPFAVSFDIAVLLYGIGTIEQPVGVKQTSGEVFSVPSLVACTTVCPLALVVVAMLSPYLLLKTSRML